MAKNAEIRDLIRRNKLYVADVAERLNISNSCLYTWLSRELTDERRKRILTAIDEAAAKQERELQRLRG